MKKMNITKNKSGSYKIRVYLGEDLNGKKLFKNTTYKPKAQTPRAIEKEVMQYAADFEKRVLTGSYLSGEELTLNEFFKIWLRDYAPKQLTASEVEEYEKTIKRVFLPALGNKKLSSINALHLQGIVSDLETKGLQPATIKKYFACISSVMNRAYKANVIHENPCMRVLLPRIEGNPNEIRYFDREQAKTFLNALKMPYTVHYPKKIRKNGRIIPAHDEIITVSLQFRALFTLAIYSGARRGELLALTWRDIDFNKYVMTINKATAHTKQKGQYIKEPKTKAGFRSVSLPGVCIDLLQEWKQEQQKQCAALGSAWEGFTGFMYDDNFIFIQETGKQMNLHTPLHKFRDILELYNSSVPAADQLPIIKFHDLRHTSASIMIASGMVDIETIARRLGHSDVSMTLNRYGHALPSQDEKAVKAISTMLSLEDDQEKPHPLPIMYQEENRPA